VRRFLAHSFGVFDFLIWNLYSGASFKPLLNLFYKPLLDPFSALLSQWIQNFIDYILSVYRLHFVCLSTTFCLFIDYTYLLLYSNKVVFFKEVIL